MAANGRFFGWHVVAGMFLNYLVIVGIVIYTLPLFYPALMAEFGWSSTEVTLAATVAYFSSAFVTPFISPLFDSRSARKLMALGACCVVLGLLLYGVIASVVAMVALYCLFALSQVLAGQVPVMVILSRWFRRRRGLAMGIVLTATSVGGGLFPLLVRGPLAAGDWRGAALLLAFVAAVMLALPLLFLIRDHPRDKGQHQDGVPLETVVIGTGEVREGPSLSQALRTPEFYLIAFATGGLWFCINAMVQHQSIIMTLMHDIDPQSLPLLVSIVFWGAVAGKVVFGLLGDHHSKQLVMLSGVICLGLGLLALRHLGAEQLYFYSLVFGFGFGGTFTMIQLLIAEYYSGVHYGRILGVLTMVDVVCGGLGISLLGIAQQALGGYAPVLDGLFGLSLAIALSVLVLYIRARAGTVTAPAAASDIATLE